MTVATIAGEIFVELGSPTNVTVITITNWLLYNIGALNNLLETSYAIVASEISPALGEAEKSIYKLMYNIYYCDLMLKTCVGAAAYDIVTEVTSDGATVRKVNRNEIAKTFLQSKKLYNEDLKDQVNSYKSNNIETKQIKGDDYIAEGNEDFTEEYLT